MAWTARSGIATAGSGNSTTVTLAKSSISGQDGDLVWVELQKDSNLGGNWTVASGETGWTFIHQQATTPGRNFNSCNAYKVVSDWSAEPTNWTFKTTDPDAITGMARAWGADGTISYDTSTASNGTNDSTPNRPAISAPSADGALIIASARLNSGSGALTITSHTPPSGYSGGEFYSVPALNCYNSYMVQTTAAAETPGAATTTASNTTAEWHASTTAFIETGGAATQTLDPALVSQTVTPSAPTVAAGNVDVDPAAVTQQISGTDPEVTQTSPAQQVDPAAPTQPLTGVDPSVLAGAVSMTPALVALAAAALEPAVLAGTSVINPTAISNLLTNLDPSLNVGAVTLFPATETQAATATDPAVVPPSQAVSAALVTEALAALGPSLIPGATALSPTLVSQPLTAGAPTVGDAISYGPFTAADFAALYRGSSLPASGDITQWDDESGNGRHLVEDISAGTNPPSVTTLNGHKAADFDDTNLETLEYDEGSEFYTGDIGIIIVGQFDTFVGASDVMLSAATGGSGTTWKHVFGTAVSGANYVIMSGDGSPGAHKTFGTPSTGSEFIATLYIRDSGDDDAWIAKTQELDATDSGGNNLRGWRVGTRETDDRPLDGKLSFVAIIEMDGYTESDLLSARDDIGAELGLTGFGTQTLEPAAASQTVSATDPTIATGAVTVTPSAVSQILAAIDPTLMAGAVEILAGLVTQSLSPTDPAIATGGAAIDPALASQPVTPTDPSVGTDSAIVSPDNVDATVTATDPSLTSGVSMFPAMETQTLSAFDPTLPAPTALVSPDAVAQALEALAIAILGGTIVGSNTAGALYRNGDRLVLVWDRGRGMGRGFKSSEGWEVASATFMFPYGGVNNVMSAVAATWTANKAAPIATLRSALNDQLTTAGYRTPTGKDVNTTIPDVT